MDLTKAEFKQLITDQREALKAGYQKARAKAREERTAVEMSQGGGDPCAEFYAQHLLLQAQYDDHELDYIYCVAQHYPGAPECSDELELLQSTQLALWANLEAAERAGCDTSSWSPV